MEAGGGLGLMEMWAQMSWVATAPTGGLSLMEMWEQMGWVAKAIGIILIIMSMWSFGVAIERYYTFFQARKQSKLYAPQVARHLKEGRLKDALQVSQSKTYQVQPPGEGRAGGVAGISVPARLRREPQP